MHLRRIGTTDTFLDKQTLIIGTNTSHYINKRISGIKGCTFWDQKVKIRKTSYSFTIYRMNIKNICSK